MGIVKKNPSLSRWHAHAVATEIQRVSLTAAVLSSTVLNSVIKACWHLILEINRVGKLHSRKMNVRRHAHINTHTHTRAHLEKVKGHLHHDGALSHAAVLIFQ